MKNVMMITFKKVFTHLGDGIMPTETSPYRESAPPISLTLNKQEEINFFSKFNYVGNYSKFSFKRKVIFKC